MNTNIKILILLALFSFSGCGDPDLITPPPPEVETDTNADDDDVDLNWLEFETETLTVAIGDIVRPNLKASFDNETVYENLTDELFNPYFDTTYTVNWSSEDETIATVNSEGEITAIQEGEVIIEATVGPLSTRITILVLDS